MSEYNRLLNTLFGKKNSLSFRTAKQRLKECGFQKPDIDAFLLFGVKNKKIRRRSK